MVGSQKEGAPFTFIRFQREKKFATLAMPNMTIAGSVAIKQKAPTIPSTPEKNKIFRIAVMIKPIKALSEKFFNIPSCLSWPEFFCGCNL